MDRREHGRVPLRLPVRLRWATPFGRTMELCDTLDVSRGGLLVPCKEQHSPGFRLWVTFPYDPENPDGQPEIPARVVRFRAADEHARASNGLLKTEGGAATHANDSRLSALALHFDVAAHLAPNGNGHRRKPERRCSPRRPLALPINVRPPGVPWFEEAMSVDVSTQGMRFLGNREYQLGQHLLVSFKAAAAPWPTDREIYSVVVRIDLVANSSALAVTVQRLP